MAWSRLQSASSTTAAATYGTNLTAGTKLIAVVCVQGSNTTTAVSDGTNNFTKLAAQLLNASSLRGELSLWARDTPAGDVGTTPTITATTGASVATIVIQEISGLLAGNTSAMLDGTAGTNSGNGGSGTLTSPTYSSTALNEYLVACYGDDAIAGRNTWTAPTGYTPDPNAINSGSGSINDAISYTNSANGAESGGYSLTGSHADNWAQILVAFQLQPPPISGKSTGWSVTRRIPVSAVWGGYAATTTNVAPSISGISTGFVIIRRVQSTAFYGGIAVQPPAVIPPPPVVSIPPAVPTSGGTINLTVRTFRSIDPCDIPAAGGQLPQITGRAFLVPIPTDTEFETGTKEPLADPGPSVMEVIAETGQAIAATTGRAVEFGRIFADPPYDPRMQRKCKALRKIGGAVLCCHRPKGHTGKHTDRGLDWR